MAKVYYDYETSNQSFLKMRKYLKNKGIKNNNFMLALYNKDLKGVDPYNPNLTSNQKIDIIKECMCNIWYYLREVIRFPAQGGGYYRFTLDVANCAQVFCTLRYMNSWVTKPRQQRKTIDSLAITNYTRIFCGFADETDFQKIRLCGRNREDCRSMKNKLKILTECLPKYIQQIDFDKYKCVNSETTMGLVKYKEQAAEIAKSFMDTFIHFADAEYIPNIDILYYGSRESLETNAILCKRRGILSCMLFESVISDDTSAEFVLNYAVKWTDEMYDFTEEDFKNIMVGKVKIIHIYTTYQDLGLSESWFKTQCIMLQNKLDVIRRELLLKRKDEE